MGHTTPWYFVAGLAAALPLGFMAACGSSAQPATKEGGSGPSPSPEAGESPDGAIAPPADAASTSEAGEADASGDGSHGGALWDAGICLAASPPVVDARDHLDAWGVNYGAGPGGPDVVAAKMNEIGMRRFRIQLAIDPLTTWQALQQSMTSGGYTKPRLRFNTLVTAYNNTSVTWEQQKAPLLAAAASGLLGSIEGPNEVNEVADGDGTHGVDSTTDETDEWAGPSGNFFAWTSAIAAWKAGLTGSDATSMAGVEVLAPTIASGLQSDYASLPDVTSLVDYGNVHYYSGSGLQPNLEQGSDNPGVGYFANIFRWARSAMTPTKPVVVTEFGADTAPGVDYGLHAQAAYLLNQMHDAAGIGARRFYIYTLFDDSTGSGGAEGNFGIFDTDGSDKPISTALASLKNLFSLKNDYDDPSNATDTAPFNPGYAGCGLTVSGIGSAGYSSRVADAVVYPKSDGSAVISVTNEPPMTDGNGNDLTPALVTATVQLGSMQSWHLYDVFSATPLVAVSSGVGTSVSVPLYGYPMYVVVDAPAGYP